MSDTVRNAVFGNVGTIISFRVSADDAPILAKQFEPQFEANDLLQMHNRHFIINMVINGEKTPAFSATTLTLPPPQIDNTGRIIEHTRLTYSRRREEVEAEIADAINPPKPAANQPAVPKPQPATTPAAPPTAAVATPEQSTGSEVATSVPQTPPVEGEAPVKKKRKRTRKRKSSSSTTSESGEGSTQPIGEANTPSPQPTTPKSEPRPKEDETVLRLR